MGQIILIVEEMTPTAQHTPTMKRITQFLNAGVAVVWQVAYDEKAVFVYRPGRCFEMVELDEELVIDEIQPGFRCRAGDFFDESGHG